MKFQFELNQLSHQCQASVAPFNSIPETSEFEPQLHARPTLVEEDVEAFGRRRRGKSSAQPSTATTVVAEPPKSGLTSKVLSGSIILAALLFDNYGWLSQSRTSAPEENPITKTASNKDQRVLGWLSQSRTSAPEENPFTIRKTASNKDQRETAKPTTAAEEKPSVGNKKVYDFQVRRLNKQDVSISQYLTPPKGMKKKATFSDAASFTQGMPLSEKEGLVMTIPLTAKGFLAETVAPLVDSKVLEGSLVKKMISTWMTSTPEGAQRDLKEIVLLQEGNTKLLLFNGDDLDTIEKFEGMTKQLLFLMQDTGLRSTLVFNPIGNPSDMEKTEILDVVAKSLSYVDPGIPKKLHYVFPNSDQATKALSGAFPDQDVAKLPNKEWLYWEDDANMTVEIPKDNTKKQLQEYTEGQEYQNIKASEAGLLFKLPNIIFVKNLATQDLEELKALEGFKTAIEGNYRYVSDKGAKKVQFLDGVFDEKDQTALGKKAETVELVAKKETNTLRYLTLCAPAVSENCLSIDNNILHQCLLNISGKIPNRWSKKSPMIHLRSDPTKYINTYVRSPARKRAAKSLAGNLVREAKFNPKTLVVFQNDDGIFGDELTAFDGAKKNGTTLAGILQQKFQAIEETRNSEVTATEESKVDSEKS